MKINKTKPIFSPPIISGSRSFHTTVKSDKSVV